MNTNLQESQEKETSGQDFELNQKEVNEESMRAELFSTCGQERNEFVPMKNIKVRDMSTQTDLSLQLSRTNVETSDSNDVNEVNNEFDQVPPETYEECEEMENEMQVYSSFPQSSNMVAPPFPDQQFPNYDTGPWQVPVPVPHYHQMGPNVYPSPPFQFAPVNTMVPTYFPTQPVYTTQFSPLDGYSYFNNYQFDASNGVTCQRNNPCCEERDFPRFRRGRRNHSNNYGRNRRRNSGRNWDENTDYIGNSEDSENINPSNPLCILNSNTNDKKVTNLNTITLDCLKEATTNMPLTIRFNRSSADSNQVRSSSRRRIFVKIENSSITGTSFPRKVESKREETPSLELTEAERIVQFPELTCDNVVLKKPKAKFPKVKYDRRNSISLNEFVHHNENDIRETTQIIETSVDRITEFIPSSAPVINTTSIPTYSTTEANPMLIQHSDSEILPSQHDFDNNAQLEALCTAQLSDLMPKKTGDSTQMPNVDQISFPTSTSPIQSRSTSPVDIQVETSELTDAVSLTPNITLPSPIITLSNDEIENNAQVECSSETETPQVTNSIPLPETTSVQTVTTSEKTSPTETSQCNENLPSVDDIDRNIKPPTDTMLMPPPKPQRCPFPTRPSANKIQVRNYSSAVERNKPLNKCSVEMKGSTDIVRSKSVDLINSSSNIQLMDINMKGSKDVRIKSVDEINSSTNIQPMDIQMKNTDRTKSVDVINSSANVKSKVVGMTYVEISKSVDSINSTVNVQPKEKTLSHKVRKRPDHKAETNKRLMPDNNKPKRPEMYKTKLVEQSSSNQHRLSNKNCHPGETVEDGWQTVRYKTRDPVAPSKALAAHNTRSKNAPLNRSKSFHKEKEESGKVPYTQIKGQPSTSKPIVVIESPKKEINVVCDEDPKEIQHDECEPNTVDKMRNDSNRTSSFYGVKYESNTGGAEIHQKTTPVELTIDASQNSSQQLKDFNDNDAKDMYSEFMEYLSCITWTAQIEEIEHFAKLLANGMPHSFLDSYSSPSIEHFEELISKNPERAFRYRNAINVKYRRIKETEEKQQQAYEKRQQLLQCKTAKVRGFVQKVEEVRATKYKLALQMKSQIDQKLKKAEENRKLHLSIIKRKAHDEEEKLKEIAFINELEAQNRRHDSLVLRQEHEERIQCIIEERQRKVEEKAAKDAAVEERRRVIEAERQAKLQEINEKRKKKEEIIDRKQQEKEKERQEIAREKAREREERLLARQAAQLANAEELQKRIQQKQEESARRHEESIELKRQKALEVGLHKATEDATTASNKSVTSNKNEEPKETGESHHYSYNELIPAFRKKCRKVQQRMALRGVTYLSTLTPPIPQNYKLATELEEFGKLIRYNYDDKMLFSVNQRLNAVYDLIKQQGKQGIKVFFNSDGFSKCRRFIKTVLIPFENPKQSGALAKLLQTMIQMLNNIYQDYIEYFLLSNDVAVIIDVLQLCFAYEKLIKKKRGDWLKLARHIFFFLLEFFNAIGSRMESDVKNNPEFNTAISDLVSYFIYCGLVHNVIDMLRSVLIDGNKNMSLLVVPSIYLFTALLNERFYTSDLSLLLKTTDCIETVYFLCESLQKMQATNPRNLPECAFPIVSMLLKFAMVDILLFQSIFGAEGMVVQLRSIYSIVISYCLKRQECEALLLSMIQLIGYFSIKNQKNQDVLQSGQQPTVLQLLISLPFQYFCNEVYMMYLFPTLLSCTHENPINRAIVEQELNYSILVEFTSSRLPGSSKLLDLFYDRTVMSKSKKKKQKKTKRKAEQDVHKSNEPSAQEVQMDGIEITKEIPKDENEDILKQDNDDTKVIPKEDELDV